MRMVQKYGSNHLPKRPKRNPKRKSNKSKKNLFIHLYKILFLYFSKVKVKLLPKTTVRKKYLSKDLFLHLSQISIQKRRNRRGGTWMRITSFIIVRKKNISIIV